MIDLIERLTEKDVRKLQNAIQFPSGLSEECATSEDFLLEIDTWEGYNSKTFFTALSSVRPDLVYLAEDIPFLKNSSLTEELDQNRQKMRKFVADLTDELTIKKWRVMLKNLKYNTDKNIVHSEIFAFCLKKYFITKNLDILTKCLKNIKREDLAMKMIDYKVIFSKMSALDFETTFKDSAFGGKKEFAIDVKSKFHHIFQM